MEFQPLQVQIYLMIRFTLMFVIVVCFSLHASCDGRQTSNPGKYITKSYFEKHDSFVDSLFDNFMANNIPLGLTKGLQDKKFLLPTVSVLHRDVIGEGSHRHLSSSIRLKMHPDFKSELARHSCKLIILERLPSGVFADPFELQHLVDRCVFSDAAAFGDTNLELPSFRSNQSVVEIHMDVASEVFTNNEDDLQVKVELPLHARYQSLGMGYSRVEFGKPDLLMCCNVEKAPSSSCSFMASEYNALHDGSLVVWEIPCGIKDHAGIVSAITFGFAILAALVIVLASVCYSKGDASNKLKHS